MSKPIGLGLPWPESFQALHDEYGGPYKIGKAIGLCRKTVSSYYHGRLPTSDKTRDKFKKYGWTEYELPKRIKDLSEGEKAARYLAMAKVRKVVKKTTCLERKERERLLALGLFEQALRKLISENRGNNPKPASMIDKANLDEFMVKLLQSEGMLSVDACVLSCNAMECIEHDRLVRLVEKWKNG